MVSAIPELLRVPSTVILARKPLEIKSPELLTLASVIFSLACTVPKLSRLEVIVREPVSARSCPALITGVSALMVKGKKCVPSMVPALFIEWATTSPVPDNVPPCVITSASPTVSVPPKEPPLIAKEL